MNSVFAAFVNLLINHDTQYHAVIKKCIDVRLIFYCTTNTFQNSFRAPNKKHINKSAD